MSVGSAWLLATIARMWQWRLRYFFGASADQLYDEYYGSQSGSSMTKACLYLPKPQSPEE